MPHKVLISLRERCQQDQGPLDRCRLACGCGCVGVQEEHIPVCHVRLGYDGGGIHSSCSTVGDGQRCGVQLGQSPDRTGCQHHTGRLLYIGLGMIHGKMAFVSPPPSTRCTWLPLLLYCGYGADQISTRPSSLSSSVCSSLSGTLPSSSTCSPPLWTLPCGCCEPPGWVWGWWVGSLLCSCLEP